MSKKPHSLGSNSEHITSLPFQITQEIKNGKVLAGDDFNDEQLKIWFSQEQEAFYIGDSGNSEVDPWYAYMRYVNEILGFSEIEKSKNKNGSMLVLGPGSGLEVDRFANSNSTWTLNFLEASNNFKIELKNRYPHSVILDPEISGSIPLTDSSQDLVCAFSVLHHIPNVSKVITEVSRVTKLDGIFLVREPCSSMGDWRYPRSATPNERGIDRQLLIDIAHEAGFELVSRPIPILFEPINKILKKTIGFSCLPFKLLYRLDRLVSALLVFNDHYWRDTGLRSWALPHISMSFTSQVQHRFS